jgi:uncharacterized membrane protein YgdD (TMEM256/DUF423 family)
MWTRRVWMALAAVGGFVAVAMGAFAAHGIEDARAAELVRTGASWAPSSSPDRSTPWPSEAPPGSAP